MSEEITIVRASAETRTQQSGSGGPAGGSADILPHVLGWGGVARQAHAECAKAADAAQELTRRRNGPGQ